MLEMIQFMTNLDEDLKKSGELVSNEGLADGSQAKTVRIKNGIPVPTDGPFAEAKESPVGYWIVDVESEARAIEIASKIVALVKQPIEVRQDEDAASLRTQPASVKGKPAPAARGTLTPAGSALRRVAGRAISSLCTSRRRARHALHPLPGARPLAPRPDAGRGRDAGQHRGEAVRARDPQPPAGGEPRRHPQRPGAGSVLRCEAG